MVLCGRQPPSYGNPGGPDGAELEESAGGIARSTGPLKVPYIPWHVTSGETEKCFCVVLASFQRPQSRTLSSLVSEYNLV